MLQILKPVAPTSLLSRSICSIAAAYSVQQAGAFHQAAASRDAHTSTALNDEASVINSHACTGASVRSILEAEVPMIMSLAYALFHSTVRCNVWP